MTIQYLKSSPYAGPVASPGRTKTAIVSPIITASVQLHAVTYVLEAHNPFLNPDGNNSFQCRLVTMKTNDAGDYLADADPNPFIGEFQNWEPSSQPSDRIIRVDDYLAFPGMGFIPVGGKYRFMLEQWDYTDRFIYLKSIKLEAR